MAHHNSVSQPGTPYVPEHLSEIDEEECASKFLLSPSCINMLSGDACFEPSGHCQNIQKVHKTVLKEDL